MIPVFKPGLFGDFATLKNVLYGSWWGTGPMVSQFEEEFAEYIGVKAEQCIMLNSCTSALHLAMLLYPRAKRVILPALTFISTGLAPLYAGKEVVFAEVDDDLCIDQSDALRKIESEDDVIVAVHMGGHPAKLTHFKNYNVVEDCAHSLGSFDQDRHTGTQGVGCFSFQSTKILPIGDGGMLVLPENRIVNRKEILAQSWCGIESTTWERTEDEEYKWYYKVTGMGYKYRANDLMAALAIDQWSHLDEVLLNKANIAKHYQEGLEDLDWLRLPKARKGTAPNWQEYIVRTKFRDQLHNHLKELGIGTTVHYYPIHTYKPFRIAEEEGFFVSQSLPRTDELFKEILTIPSYAGMNTREQAMVIDGIRSFKP